MRGCASPSRRMRFSAAVGTRLFPQSGRVAADLHVLIHALGPEMEQPVVAGQSWVTAMAGAVVTGQVTLADLVTPRPPQLSAALDQVL